MLPYRDRPVPERSRETVTTTHRSEKQQRQDVLFRKGSGTRGIAIEAAAVPAFKQPGKHGYTCALGHKFRPQLYQNRSCLHHRQDHRVPFFTFCNLFTSDRRRSSALSMAISSSRALETLSSSSSISGRPPYGLQDWRVDAAILVSIVRSHRLLPSGLLHAENREVET